MNNKIWRIFPKICSYQVATTSKGHLLWIVIPRDSLTFNSSMFTALSNPKSNLCAYLASASSSTTIANVHQGIPFGLPQTESTQNANL